MSDSPMHARLDLTGQASEDEPASRAQTNAEQHRERSGYGPSSTQQQNSSGGSDNNDDDRRSRNDNDDSGEIAPPEGEGGVLARLVPSPIDLWRSGTPASLLLLPLVFVLYVLLQLPLHHNSRTENGEWRGRAKDVDKLSGELNDVKDELDNVKDDQAEIRGEVTSLRRRLGRIKEGRRRREEYLAAKKREREEEERLEMERQQGVMAKEGPITTVTMAKALAVSTFAGKLSPDDPTKKEK